MSLALADRTSRTVRSTTVAAHGQAILAVCGPMSGKRAESASVAAGAASSPSNSPCVAEYALVGDGIWARDAAALPPLNPGLLAFDVDGVLIDVHSSYPQVISSAVQLYCVRFLGWPDGQTIVSPEETALWKRAGGFNSDWNLARGACLYAIWRARTPGAPALGDFLDEVRRRGGGLSVVQGLCGRQDGWDPELIERVCCELYGGDDHCEAMFGYRPEYHHGPGLCNSERPIVQRRSLEPWRGRLGVYTGRNDGETSFALGRCGVADLFPPEARTTCDHGWRKPDPAGLRRLVANLGTAHGLFAGDNVDDCDTVARYRESGDVPPFFFAGVLGGSPGPAAYGLFAERGADLIARDVTALLTFLHPA